MTKLRDLKTGDRARLTYVYEGEVTVGDGYIIVGDFSAELDDDEYDDLVSVQLLEHKLQVGDEVSATALVPLGTVVRYINTNYAAPLFKTPAGWASSATIDVMHPRSLGEGDVFRIEYLPE